MPAQPGRQARRGWIALAVAALVIAGAMWTWLDVIPPGPGAGEATVYFATPNAMYLVPVDVALRGDAALERLVVQALLDGPPPSSGLVPTIPASVHVRGVQRKGSLVSVDFSREIVADHSGGSAGEGLTIYSIVNSLTELPGVERVEILVEGSRVDSLKGHYDVREPLRREEGMIEPAWRGS